MNQLVYKSPLHEMTCTTPTDLWNDSCSIEELNYTISHGGVGATTNPVIVGNVLKKEMPLWSDQLSEMIQESPDRSEDEITWQLIEALAVKGASLLEPAFKEHKGMKGRLSIQTNPKYAFNQERMVEQACYFNTLAPNMQVKIPVTSVGVKAIEEATYRGVNINATVSFSVPQTLAVAEAVERGLKRREAEGHDVSGMSPVCTIMVGRIDDWLRFQADRDDITTDPGYFNYAGVAIMKQAYQVYQERGYRSRLLAAAYRCHMHWSEFIGGDLVVSIPYEWQVRFNQSDISAEPRIDNPVDPKVVDELRRKFSDFEKAYANDGMSPEEFDDFGPNRRTLRQFLEGYDSLVQVIRNRMIASPDVK
ncbi:MAG: transaldolase family protein [Candidatus Hinthialibacter antarcticus]|nr:transaldolase family protein [Candidatus Hinthialibacter antarcticus]